MTLVAVHWDYLGDADRAIYDNAYRYLVRRDDHGTHRIGVAISIDEAGELESLARRHAGRAARPAWSAVLLRGARSR